MNKVINKSISQLIILFAVGINGIISAQTSNYLTIGDMESGGWTIKNLVSDATLVYETEAGTDGTKAMKTTATSIGASSYYVIIGTSQPLTLNQGEYYTISYWAKTPDAAGLNLTPWIQIADATINYPFVNLQSGVLTDDWKQYTYTFSYPLVSSNKALFKFRVSTAGTIYIDNVKIGPADPKDIPDYTLSDEPIYAVNIASVSLEEKLPVYKSNCPLYMTGYMGMQTKDDIPLTLFKGRSISWTNFSFSDSVRVVVEVLNEDKVPISGENIRILPSRFNIIPSVEGNKVSFTLSTHGQFSVEIGEEGYKNGLMIFANPLETNVPDLSDPEYLVLEPDSNLLLASEIPTHYKGIYFKKGEHNIDVFVIPPHIKNIYLADSAWVYGAFQAFEGSGIKIFGRGVLSQAKMNYRVAHGIDIRTDGATVEGIVVADYKYFAVRLMGSNNEISWVKVIGGWVYNCDGITAYANSSVKNCFIWANDDAIKVYLSNIVWSDIVVWQLNNGGVIQTSWGRTQAHNCTISRVDVLRAEWVKAGHNAALLSCVGNHYQEPDRYSIQNNWLIEDVVTETQVPIIFGINPNPFSANDVRNFTLKNWDVKMTEGVVFKNRIIAGNPNTIIDGFVFDNFIFNDVLLTQENWFETLKIDTSGFKMPLVLPSLSKIEHQTAPAHKIYPNPVRDILIVENVNENAVLKVYNLNAALMLNGKGKKLNVSTLENGYYILMINDVLSGMFKKTK